MARAAILLLLVLVSGCGAAAPAGPPVRPAGTIVFVSDANRLTTIDMASGDRTSRRIRAIAACGADLFVTGGRVVFSGILKHRTTVFSVPLSLDRRPTRLGAAHQFLPSATGGRVWLLGTDCDRVRMVGAREVAVDGAVTFESGHRVPGTWVYQAVSGRLVVDHGRLWDPGTGEITGRVGLEAAFAAHGPLLAGCPESDCRTLAIVDTRSGRTVRAGDGLDPGARFSPDGSWLATPILVRGRWAAALVDARTGAHTVIRGTGTGKWYPQLRWSRSGWLFVLDHRRVRAYRPGAPRAETLTFRLPDSVLAFAAD